MTYAILNTVAFVLTIVGALNWGLIGIANANLVTYLFGGFPILVNVIYSLVGISGLYLAFKKGSCKTDYDKRPLI